MLLSRCAWHPRYRGYPLLGRVVSWSGFNLRFTDGICRDCAERFRAEYRAFIARRSDHEMGGPEMAPHTPQRSWRPGEAVAPLGPQRAWRPGEAVTPLEPQRAWRPGEAVTPLEPQRAWRPGEAVAPLDTVAPLDRAPAA